MLPGIEPSLDFAIVANYAEAINGRLFLGGGGLENVTALAGVPCPIGLAIGILVPWMGTNRDHALQVRLENADGHHLLNMQMNLRAGRPAELEDGSSQRLIAAFTFGVVFPAGGRHVFVVSAGTEERRPSIVVRLSGPPALPPAQQP